MSGYEPSKHLDTFNIAGFQHWDGATVISELKVGHKLELEPQRDNPYDANAIAIRFNGTMLGYVPGAKNELMSTMAFFGHADVFECRVLKVDTEADPWEQVLVGIYITDAR